MQVSVIPLSIRHKDYTYFFPSKMWVAYEKNYIPSNQFSVIVAFFVIDDTMVSGLNFLIREEND